MEGGGGGTDAHSVRMLGKQLSRMYNHNVPGSIQKSSRHLRAEPWIGSTQIQYHCVLVLGVP